MYVKLNLLQVIYSYIQLDFLSEMKSFSLLLSVLLFVTLLVGPVYAAYDVIRDNDTAPDLPWKPKSKAIHKSKYNNVRVNHIREL